MAQTIEYSIAPVESIEVELGRRLEAVRLARNISQSQLAGQAGVSRRTITRLENGHGVSVDTLIRVLQSLGLAERLASLVPDADVRPIDRIRLKGRERQRARPDREPATSEWHWAESSD